MPSPRLTSLSSVDIEVNGSINPPQSPSKSRRSKWSLAPPAFLTHQSFLPIVVVISLIINIVLASLILYAHTHTHVYLGDDDEVMQQVNAASRRTMTVSDGTESAEYKALQTIHQQTLLELNALRQQQQQSAQTTQTVQPVQPPVVTIQSDCRMTLDSLPSTDLSSTAHSPPFDVATHDVTYDFCQNDGATHSATLNSSIHYCEETAINEQYFQLTFFDRPGAGSKSFQRKGKPVSPSCVQLPPLGYQWPPKTPLLPCPVDQTPVHWPNLRVSTLTDLLVFNRGSPKNLYHFNSSFYDREQATILDSAAKHIPFGPKVRLMLDVGAGGGSLGLHIKQRYDVSVISTVFADWPYCEFITERGGICMFVDAMEAMPFAKFSFDVIHTSWVFHALFTNQLRTAFLEQHRLLRPGGYMWIQGGWSLEQVETIQHLFVTQLGYRLLHEERHTVKEPGKHKFDTVPYELTWSAILVRPIAAKCGSNQRGP